jgi:aminoglycoside phosphotransferase (APT) family kinase protein
MNMNPAHDSEQEQPVPDRMLRWVLDAVDPRATIVSAQRLPGGISSAVHRITLATMAHGVQNVVLRRFDNADWLRNEPDLARHESESLRWAQRTGVPTPQIVAYDETGSNGGMPAVLMSHLQGSVVLRPRNPAAWLHGLAHALVRIHAVEADEFPWAYATYNDIAALQTPEWSRVPELWGAAINRVRGPRPATRECFIHRDYHPANVLWANGAVSGVVDWVNACRGPAGIDVGHCRLNLAMLYDVPTADAFLAAYQSFAGPRFRYDPYWDLLSLIEILHGPPAVYAGWVALGVTDLTDQRIAERLDDYLIRLSRP